MRAVYMQHERMFQCLHVYTYGQGNPQSYVINDDIMSI